MKFEIKRSLEVKTNHNHCLPFALNSAPFAKCFARSHRIAKNSHEMNKHH